MLCCVPSHKYKYCRYPYPPPSLSLTRSPAPSSSRTFTAIPTALQAVSCKMECSFLIKAPHCQAKQLSKLVVQTFDEYRMLFAVWLVGSLWESCNNTYDIEATLQAQPVASCRPWLRPQTVTNTNIRAATLFENTTAVIVIVIYCYTAALQSQPIESCHSLLFTWTSKYLC